jgi:murein DD-endopeptidase MepM/ murein hydrolase activator NlpD
MRISSISGTIPTTRIERERDHRHPTMSARSQGFGRFLSRASAAGGCARGCARVPVPARVRVCIASLAGALCLLLARPDAFAQGSAGTTACVDARDVVTVPKVPRAGALFEIRVPPLTGIAGRPIVTVAGVPLVARTATATSAATRADTVRWLAAVPIDSTTGVTVRVSCAADVPPLLLRLAVDSGRYRRERLRVAPRFAAKPDSALAARLEREAARAGAVSRAALETRMLWHAPFIAPRPSRITSAFGNLRMFNGETVSWHNGTDYAGAVGTPVRAANRGVVRLTGAFYLGGNVVYLDHGAGLTTAYLHLSRTLVAEGDTVERGAVIGRTGATGRVTGPHLHFIVRLGGITVDPLTLIGRR